jgi:hypothetical protein
MPRITIVPTSTVVRITAVPWIAITVIGIAPIPWVTVTIVGTPRIAPSPPCLSRHSNYCYRTDSGKTYSSKEFFHISLAMYNS